jgi:hypothetical protein
LEGALEAGQLVYAQLPESDKAKLTAYVVDQSKPVQALFDTAKAVRPTLDVVVQVVKNDPVMMGNLKVLLAERALENAPALDRWYRQQLTEAAKVATKVGTSTALMEQAVRGWPKAFFAKLPTDFRSDLRQALNEASDASTADKVFGSWPPAAGLQLQIAGSEIEVRLGMKIVKVELQNFIEVQSKFALEAVVDYAEDAALSSVETARSSMQRKLETLVTSAVAAHDDLAWRVIASVNEIDDSASLSRLIPKSQDGTIAATKSAKLFDNVWQQIPKEAQASAAMQLAAAQAGSMIGKDVVSAALRRPSGNPALANGIPGKAQDAVLKAALAAAFPAAGAAIVAADALSALGEMNSLADRINALTAEDRQIMAEQLTLYDLVRDESAAVALADLGIRIAEKRNAGAKVQAKRYRDAADRLDEASIKAVGAQKLYLPRAFLIAEQLRYQFDKLDRSLAFWTGDPRAPRGQISRELSSDPQWLRYALDPSIQLFTWLDRDGESDRGDLRRLLAEWQQKLQIADLVCDKLHCKKDNAVVGDVNASPEISLKASVPDQWQKFLRWKDIGNGDFTFEFLMTPALLKPDRKMHNIRFVAARAGVERNGAMVSLENVRLDHSGAAYVPYEDGFIKEHYLPKTAFGVNWRPLGDLRTRWTGTLALLPLEGYGIYTVWRIVLPDSLDARMADDVRLQFNYQFQEKSFVPDDRSMRSEKARKNAWKVTMKASDNVQVTLPLSDLPFLGSEVSGRSSLEAIAKEPEAAKVGLHKIMLIEEKGGVVP